MAFVMGTAGHIDHGKTSLVRALTGIDCDRLEEEKRRGITIELGFAFCTLPNGQRLGIVDVPGHERFIKNMVAGASGIDFVMLVIAADEGVMPQTREHLEICSLLGIRHGLIALTKIDSVDAELLELATEDIAHFVQGTFLEEAPVFPVSSLTGDGLDALRNYIFQQDDALQTHQKTDLFRLPIDRMFTVKGHGTIVTGTMLSGHIDTGDTLEILPKGLLARVRSLQSHGENTDTALAGKRTAVNLHNIDMHDLNRGDVLACPNTLFPSERWLVRLRCLASSPRPLKHRTEVHFHHGAREISARLYFFGQDTLEPGDTALCDVRFAAPMVGIFDDHCVIRSFSPLRTVAGGTIIHPLADSLANSFTRKDMTPERITKLLQLPKQDNNGKVQTHTHLAGVQGVTVPLLTVLTNLSAKALEKSLQALLSQGDILCFDRDARAYIATSHLPALEKECIETAKNAHAKDPLKTSLPRGVLLGNWTKNLSPKLCHVILERLIRQQELIQEGEGLRYKDHRVALGGTQIDLHDTLLALYTKSGLTPPTLKEAEAATDADAKTLVQMLSVLSKEEHLIKIKDGVYYHAPLIHELKTRLQTWFATNTTLEPADFKAMTNLSRKFAIPLLEYFDKEHLTIRVGDIRKLRRIF